ncbi:hypothetical protein BaRGS_00036157, partial [Batillaria attramentaria]
MAMAAKFRRHTIMLIAGSARKGSTKRKMRAKEAEVMRTQLRSLSRVTTGAEGSHAPLLGRPEALITQRKLECDKCRVPRPEKVETRLELVCTEFGKLLEMNRALMDEIHHLTQERTLVIKIFNGLQLRLAKLSKETVCFYCKITKTINRFNRSGGGNERQRRCCCIKIPSKAFSYLYLYPYHTMQATFHIDVASEMYNQQDSAKRAMVKLHEHYEKSAATFEGQMNNFECGIDAFKRIEKFMTQKNKHRPDDGRERRRQLRDQLTATEKENLMYQSVVQQIRTVLGDEELNEIVDTFIELVEENYMLFINVAEAEDIEKKIEHADSIIQSYITGVLIILYNLDYTDSEIKELAGVLGKVEERNVLRFLGEIEEYANKLWGIQNYVEYTAYHKRKADSPIAEAILPNQPRVRLVPREAVVAPAAYDEDDEDHLPLEGRPSPVQLGR